MNDIFKELNSNINTIQGEYRENSIKSRYGKEYEYPYWHAWDCYSVTNTDESIPEEIDSIQIDCRKVDFNALKIAHSIKCLSITGLKNTNISKLLELSVNLNQLHLHLSNIIDINFISYLSSLKHLYIEGFGKLINLEPLKNLQELDTLVLSGLFNAINFEPLKELVKLKGLELRGRISGGMPSEIVINSFNFLNGLHIQMLRLFYINVGDNDLWPIVNNNHIKFLFLEFPNFSLNQIAFLAAYFHSVYNDYHSAQSGWNICKKCEKKMVSILGENKRKQICPYCNPGKIVEYQSTFDKLVNDLKKTAQES